ncbi:MAG TPA: IS630 family transposase [Candidatus Solibacter sp.]|nr:IS630 family transposase [Candidatus Solibacter sp.]
MDGSIGLRTEERKVLLWQVRRGIDPQQRLRAHVLLLLADGWSWNVIAAVLFTSSSTINRWRRRFQTDRLAALQPAASKRRSRLGSFWIALVIRWVTMQTPLHFGFLRSRWTCDTIVVLLREDHGIRVGRETVRRWLHRENLVWRRPRPVLGPKDPQHAAKVRKIKALLRNLPVDEVAVFQDEVDVNTNPKIGAMWMRRGQQAEVVTPGTNTKRYLAGSLNWRTGALIVTKGKQRNADLFLGHLDELRGRLRCYKRIHVICDNAVFHRPDRCRKMREYLKRWRHRVVLHFLPTYAPETNPIERIWWHLHEEITRNHRCPTIDDLLQLIFDWLEARKCYLIETSLYRQPRAA